MADKDEKSSTSQPSEQERTALPVDIRRKSVVWSKAEVEEQKVQVRRTVEDALPLFLQEPTEGVHSASSSSEEGDNELQAERAQESSGQEESQDDAPQHAQQGRRKSVVWCASVPQEPTKAESQSESESQPQAKAQAKSGSRASIVKGKLNRSNSQTLISKRRSVAADDRSPRRQSEKSSAAKQNASERRQSERRHSKKTPRRQSMKNQPSSPPSLSRRTSKTDKPMSPKRRNSLSAVLAAANLESEAEEKDSPAEGLYSFSNRKSMPETTGALAQASSGQSSRESLIAHVMDNQHKSDDSQPFAAPRAAGSHRPSVLEVSHAPPAFHGPPGLHAPPGSRRPSVLEVSHLPPQAPRRPSWRLETQEGSMVSSRRPSRIMGFDDLEGKFRDNMTRRQIYSNVKQMMEDSSDSDSSDDTNKGSKRDSKIKRFSKKADERKSLSFYQISKAVAQAARKVVLKTRIADMFCGISYEHQMREELARVTQKSLKERDWEQLLVDLNDIHEEINTAEESKGTKLDLSLFSEQISSAVSSLQAQQKAVQELESCMGELQAIEQEADQDPEAMWIKLLDVKDHLKNLDRSTEEFSEMMLVLGFPKHAGEKGDDSDSDEDSPKKEDRAHDQAQNILNSVPDDVLQRLKNSIADADHEDWENKEAAARQELSQLGATEYDMPHVVRALRAEVWSQCVDTAVVGLHHVSHAGESVHSHKIKHSARSVEERLMKHHPHARERAQLARRKRRQSFRVHLQRKMSVFNKRKMSVAARPGMMHSLQEKLAGLETHSDSPRSSHSSPRAPPRRRSLTHASLSTEAKEVRKEAQALKRSTSIDFDTHGSATVVNFLAPSPPTSARRASNERRGSLLERRTSLLEHRVSFLERRTSLLHGTDRRTSFAEDMSGFAIVGRRTSAAEGDGSGMFPKNLRGSLQGHNLSRLSALSSLPDGRPSGIAMAKDISIFRGGDSSGSSSEAESANSDAMGPLPSECDSLSSLSSQSEDEDSDGDDAGGTSSKRRKNKRARGRRKGSQASSSSYEGSPRASMRGSLRILGGARNSIAEEEEGLSEEEHIRAIKSQYSGHMVTIALGELLESISLRWSSFEEAQTFLSTCGGEIGGDGRIAVCTMHEALQVMGYRRSCAEVCCLFMALGVPCSERSTLSTAEFTRLSNFADWHHREESQAQRAEFLLGQLELRRVLLGSLTDSERLLTGLHLALARVSATADAAGRHIRTNDEEATDDDAALCLALHGCCMQLAAAAPDSTDFAQAMLTQTGLSVFVAVIALRSALAVVRILASYILSQALVLQGFAEVTLSFLGSHTKVPSIVDLLDAAQLHAARVGSERRICIEAPGANSASTSTSDLAALYPGGPLSLLKASGRDLRSGRSDWQTPTSPNSWSVAREPREPTERERFLMANLWRPLLDIIDPEGPGPPPPLDSRFLASLLQIFQQVHVPEIVVGPGCAAVAPLVAASLHKLHLSQIAPPVLEKLLKDFELLEESHEMMGNPRSETGSSAQVHMLAVAFGGCRLLREQLAQLPADCDSGSVRKGERILRMWRGIRQRLLLRWPAAKQHSGRLTTIETIKKATLEAEKEGFELESPLLASSGLLTSESSKVALPPMRLSCIGGCLFEEGSIEMELIQRLVRRWQSTQALGRCVESSASLISREHTPGQRLSSLMAHAELPSVRAQTAPAGASRASGRMSARLSPASRAGTADGGQRLKAKVMPLPWTVPARDPSSESFRSRTATPRAARHIGPLKDQLSGKAQLPRSMTATPRAAGHVDLLTDQVLGKLQLPDKVQVPRSSTATPRAAGRVGGLRRGQLANKVQLPSL